MKKRLVLLIIAIFITIGVSVGGGISVYAAEDEYAWVLVDTYRFPVPEYFRQGDFWNYYAKFEGNTVELRTTAPGGLGIYGSTDYSNPPDLHAKYTWTNPKNVIKAKENVMIKLNQEVISYKSGNYSISYSPNFYADVDGLELGYGTASGRSFKGTYTDGTEIKNMKLHPDGNSDVQFQKSTSVDLTVEFFDSSTEGTKKALYVSCYAGPPGSVGTRYTYEWKKVKSTETAVSQPTESLNLGKYSWEGEWDSNWGKMILTQTGSKVTGTYTHDNGKINGTILGNVLTGTWSESPSYSPPSDAGDVELTMAADGKSFTGKWRYGSEGSWGNWEGGKRLTEVVPAPSTPIETTQTTETGGSAEVFESGTRIMWEPVNCLGYRLFRSTSQSDIGISVTDFYITSTSYADVNVKPNTTYYYTVKPVLAEANPFQGIDEKLGNTIATFTLQTGNSIYKPDSYKHFIMLQIDNKYMSVDGINREIDPGKGTTPIILSGRTMIPIRALVEAMGGTVQWEDSTRKITLSARRNIVEMWLGKIDIVINKVSKEMDVMPTVQNERTFVPVRFAAENLNCKVDWINSTKQAVIIYEE